MGWGMGWGIRGIYLEGVMKVATNKFGDVATCSYIWDMNKTNPIGVRFRADLLEKLKNDHGIDSPQKALVFYERFFVTHGGCVRDVKSPLRDDILKKDQKEARKHVADVLTKPKNALKPQERPELNNPAENKPKTLEELKRLCPFPERSDERSEWIRTQRPKYGI